MNNPSFYYEKDYTLLYNQLIDRLLSKKSERIFNVQKAFTLAEELHKPQFRKSGEPYILHPVIVATILERLDFDTDVISAALLHDVVEDCNYPVESIKENFNSTIAQIVDAVTAIEKEDYALNEDTLFDDENFLKYSLESQTFHKLMKIGKENKFAFYIKFADRLHNMKTLGAVEEYKRLEKVKETQKWILPLCQLLKSHYFYNEISNECFKVINEKKGESFFREYDNFSYHQQKRLKQLQEVLLEHTHQLVNKNKHKHQPLKVVYNARSHENIYNAISHKLQTKSITNIHPSHFLKVPTADIYITFKGDLPNNAAQSIMFEVLEDKRVRSFLHIEGFTTDEQSGIHYFVVGDSFKNVFRICAISQKNYLTFMNGSTEGTTIDLIDEENSNEIITDYIKVKTRSGEIMEIPENSTVLDFAFKLHNDLGFSFKYATINNSPSKLPHYTKINNGDKISIVCEKDENNNLKNIAKIRWLAYVKTESAKKVLIRHFEKSYEG